MNKLNVFILAAGLGERLRPITYHIPKPLLPVLGKPLLQSVLENVLTLPVNKIGINLHHKKKDIENWIKQSEFNKTVRLFPEETILGTGGALKNAEAFLSKGTFLTHNSDILTDIDLSKLLKFHLSTGNIATLAVHDCPEFNDVVIDGRGFLKGIGKTAKQTGKERQLAFTGIAVYETEFFKFLPAGVSSVVGAWIKAVSSGHKVGTYDVSSCYWSDIGTPPAYASAVVNALRADGEVVYIHTSIDVCKHVELDGYVVVEKQCRLNKEVSLRNCIMLPDSIAESDSRYENCIIGPGFKIDIRESDMLDLSGDDKALLIGTGGSARKYFRTKKDKNRAVLMQCTDEDPDFQRQIAYTRFFLKHAVPIPDLIEIDSDKMTALFEDLGDFSLYSWLKCPREQKQVESIYRRVIDALLMIHTEVTEHVSECPLLRERVFDYEHLRWETGYFIERFVQGIKNIRVNNTSALNEEFHRLALRVDSFPKTVIHRDFQSQNIMITKGGIPRLIDYQGARMGPPVYDVVSILWDPYYRLKSEMRESLLNYYMSQMAKKAGERFNGGAFRETLLPCRLQRHMQALGAYGFLSLVKRKKYFLKYVPEGLRLLKEDISLSKDKYPVLYDLVMGL